MVPEVTALEILLCDPP